MTASICALCSSFFEARTSYGLCPACWTRDRLREYDRVASVSTHARRAHAQVTLSLVEWLSVVSDFKGLCAYCLTLPFSRIEMVNPAAGLTYANVVPCCRACAVHKEHTFEAASHRVQSYLAGDRLIESPDMLDVSEELEVSP
ncbi:MAG: hypothetical protein ABI324_18645 [Ktedonobacteraceae bacterium]